MKYLHINPSPRLTINLCPNIPCISTVQWVFFDRDAVPLTTFLNQAAHRLKIYLEMFSLHGYSLYSRPFVYRGNSAGGQSMGNVAKSSVVKVNPLYDAHLTYNSHKDWSIAILLRILCSVPPHLDSPAYPVFSANLKIYAQISLFIDTLVTEMPFIVPSMHILL